MLLKTPPKFPQPFFTMKLIPISFLAFLLLHSTISSSFATRHKPDPYGSDGGDIPGFGGGYFGPGSGGGYNIPGFGGGYGGGYGGPKGGYGKGGIVRQTVVCSVKGPCYKKKLTCPAKCFKSFSRSGKGYGGGGGGGGCTIDCQKKCVAYC